MGRKETNQTNQANVNHLWARLSYPENQYITKFVVCCLLQFLLKLEGLIVFFLDGDDKISPAFIIGPVKPVDFFFSKLTLSNRNTIRVSNGLDPDQD